MIDLASLCRQARGMHAWALAPGKGKAAWVIRTGMLDLCMWLARQLARVPGRAGTGTYKCSHCHCKLV